jgi:hypothetical protein
MMSRQFEFQKNIVRYQDTHTLIFTLDHLPIKRHHNLFNATSFNVR